MSETGEGLVVEDGGAITRHGVVVGFVTVREVPAIREALAALDEVLGYPATGLCPEAAVAINGLAEAAQSFRNEDGGGFTALREMAITGLIDAADEVIRQFEVLEYDEEGAGA